jgi:hypothetical protein
MNEEDPMDDDSKPPEVTGTGGIVIRKPGAGTDKDDNGE